MGRNLINANSTSNLANPGSLFQDLITTGANSDIKLRSGEIRVNLTKLPFFSDHAFQNMIVLPGSAYAELAMVIYSNFQEKLPDIIKNINLGNLTLLTDEDIILKYEVTAINDNTLKIEFSGKDSVINKSFSTSLEIGNSDIHLDADNRVFN
jgi:hypothetical protein